MSSTILPPARRRRVRSAASSSKTADQRLERAAAALFRLIVSEAAFRDAGRDFIISARSLDRGAVVAHAAARLAAALPNSSRAEANSALWRDVQRLVRWHDVADLEAQGRA